MSSRSPSYKAEILLPSQAPSMSPDNKKQWARAQSAKILTRNMIIREQTKEHLEQERNEKFHVFYDRRMNYLNRWKDKMKRSPFNTDLVAESERITEEANARYREDEARKRQVIARRDKAKNDIILTALSEFSDLEALRQEKRAILEEEQRILALLALEKTSHHSKSDRIVAERALKQRQAAKTSYRRQNYKDELERIQTEEQLALRAKHGLEPLDSLRSLSTRSGLSSSGSDSRSISRLENRLSSSAESFGYKVR